MTHRNGPGELENAVGNRNMEVVPINDLSYFERHRTQTALFINYLR